MEAINDTDTLLYIDRYLQLSSVTCCLSTSDDPGKLHLNKFTLLNLPDLPKKEGPW